jgi:lipopolysaccharide/colanic/teichoic acid biosynthesis glycosyltransferase
MLTGPEYWNSSQERKFDLALATSARPFAYLARVAAKRLYLPDGEDTIFYQKRTGQNHEPFSIEKIQTLDPATAKPFNAWASLFRQLGLDELTQVGNIRDRKMSVVGYRPLIHEEYEQVRDNLPSQLGAQWDQVIHNTLPGVVSSYGVYSHSHPVAHDGRYEMRATMDIMDAQRASVAYDSRVLISFAIHGLVRDSTQPEVRTA